MEWHLSRRRFPSPRAGRSAGHGHCVLCAAPHNDAAGRPHDTGGPDPPHPCDRDGPNDPDNCPRPREVSTQIGVCSCASGGEEPTYTKLPPPPDCVQHSHVLTYARLHTHHLTLFHRLHLHRPRHPALHHGRLACVITRVRTPTMAFATMHLRPLPSLPSAPLALTALTAVTMPFTSPPPPLKKTSVKGLLPPSTHLLVSGSGH